MSGIVDRWVDQLEETLLEAADRFPQQETRAGVLGGFHGADFPSYLAEQASAYTGEEAYADELDDDASYTIGGKAMDRFLDREEYGGWRDMTESLSFAAGQFGGLMAPGLLYAATMNPVFLAGYAVGPAVNAANYLEDMYRDDTFDEHV
ncbi:MAG: hypothetical protein SV186_02585 [Candidatus Nanohaloarchaea archaeon]|nr:hypothetical protein [Candidatus Nanohaloarchaea archaeon]